VSTETFEYNTTWRELVEGLGFQKEGTARDYLYRDDQFWDKEMYALLEHEYNERFDVAADERSPEAAV
jgi:RimJ/RimL family protein N-acetyltransferase